MKRIIALVVLGAIFVIASTAAAAGVKVPKLLCFDMDNYNDKHQLAIKSSGAIYDPLSNVKTYAITGRDRYGIITGSGYVAPGTTIMYASYSGSHQGFFATYDLVIDLTDIDNAGTINNHFIATGSLSNSSPVDIIDCTTLDASFDGVDGDCAACP